MRLQKYMAHCGVAPRRKCEEIIKQGRVRVNGETVIEPGMIVDPEKDSVIVDGKPIFPETRQIYILLNKPRGYIVTAKDTHGRPTVLSLIGRQPVRVYPVGRLDMNSEGLLILTNDGELALRLTHPRYGIEKEYYVVVSAHPSGKQVQMLTNGVDIGDSVATAHRVVVLWQNENGTAFKVTLKEGKKRQIRRMFQVIGCPVRILRRIRIANLTLGSLKPGEWRYLSNKEIDEIKRLTGVKQC
ncbi:MAG: rRNA pseudouridine synthase [Clostridiales bacterium]|jgi:23S rRNA pseudouridine2605 synthase|nr:rRNA pseudouridine synthase [Clostridiales bacterium]